MSVNPRRGASVPVAVSVGFAGERAALKKDAPFFRVADATLGEREATGLQAQSNI
jgi:hypothetical protein